MFRLETLKKNKFNLEQNNLIMQQNNYYKKQWKICTAAVLKFAYSS